MGKVIVIEFVSLDGVIEDPDGSGDTPRGGWRSVTVQRRWREPSSSWVGCWTRGHAAGQGRVAAVLRIWPSREDEFSRKMNTIPKLVASRSLEHVDEWANSTLLKGALAAEASTLRQTQDVVVAGSASVVDELEAHDLIDQYRLLVFPAVLGEGRLLFDRTGRPIDLELASAESEGQAVRLVYNREPAK